MDSIVNLAFEAIKRNVTKGYGLKAAEQSPGTWHKDYLHKWPRDSIFVALELMKYDRIFAEKIVESVMDLPSDNGLFYQRYEQDNQPDPHGWCNNDDSRQLDQDALRFVALSCFPKIKVNMKSLRKSYSEFLRLIKERKPSTDVWEQKRGYFFYTTATIIWGLLCAEKVIPNLKSHDSVLKEIIKSIDSFYDEKLKSFVKSPSERIIDLEVILGLNVLFESGLDIFESNKDLSRVVSTLEALEEELCYVICGIKVPIRYKRDIWDGEFVSQEGNCRPWPMGCAMISQAYSHVAEKALKIGNYNLHAKALRDAKRWMDYLEMMPNIEHFPEQIDYDGSLPENVPKPLTWCASEIIKAQRLYVEAKKGSTNLLRKRPLYYN